MKKLNIILVVLFANSPIFAQSFRNLKVFKSSDFNPKASITVESKGYDPLIAEDALRNALVVNGFKVISERVAREIVELNNTVNHSDNSINQSITIGKTKTVNSIYFVTISYQSRANVGACDQVMSQMTGQIIDLTKDGQIVATFSFSQGGFEGKCTLGVMGALASKLKS